MGSKYIVTSLFEPNTMNNQEKYNTSNSSMFVNATRDLVNNIIPFDKWQEMASECSNGDLLTAISKAKKEAKNKEKIAKAIPSQETVTQWKRADKAHEFIKICYANQGRMNKAVDLCQAIVSGKTSRHL